jgi:hypothetical protein
MASKARDLSNFISVATVDASEIASNAVTADKIADVAVTHAKLHTDMNLSGKTLTFATNQISGNAIDGGVISNFTSTGIDDNSSATAVTILSDGKVGIGDTTPQALLDVGGGYGYNTTVATFAHATDAYIEIENMTSQNGAGIILTNAGTKKWTIQKDTSAHSLHIQDTSADVMTFLQGGNVGIGISPEAASKLEINAGADGAVAISARSDGGNGNNRRFNILPYADGGTYGGGIKLQTRNSSNVFNTALTITSSGNVGIGTDSPSRQLSLYGSAPYIALQNSSTGILASDGFQVQMAGLDAYVHNYEAGKMILGSGGHSNCLTIDTSGNTAIGATGASGYKLAVSGVAYIYGVNNNTTGQLKIVGTNGGDAQVSMSTDGNGRGFYVDQSGANAMRFYTGYGKGVAEREITFDNFGHLLVGKTSTGATQTGIELHGSTNGGAYSTISSGNTWHVHNTSAYTFYVANNGGVKNFSANNANLSDRREKKNIELLESQWDSLKQWSVKKFHYNADDDSENKKYGVIAQEVEIHNPEVIGDFKTSDDTTRMAVKEEQMMWLAIKALQEAMEKIEVLEARLNAAGVL